MLTDGSITGADGDSPLCFPGSTYGEYYIVIRHRNHLPIMSATTVVMDSSVVEYDFRPAATRSYGLGAVQLPGGKFGMAAGYLNRTRGIGATDLARVRQSMSPGPAYLDADCDMDGAVTTTDLMLTRNNIGRLAVIR